MNLDIKREKEDHVSSKPAEIMNLLEAAQCSDEAAALGIGFIGLGHLVSKAITLPQWAIFAKEFLGKFGFYPVHQELEKREAEFRARI